MQFRGGDAAVLARAEDDEAGTGIHGDVREGPLAEVGGVVGQEPSAGAGRGGPGILQFEPVRRIAIDVTQAAGIVREKLGNGELGRRAGTGQDQGRDGGPAEQKWGRHGEGDRYGANWTRR